MTIFLFILGFVFLIKGADYLVDGSASIAKKFNISNIVGLTIVAFGTSAPELIVNILAVLKGSSDLAISNIVGSNMANIFLILGITSLIYPLKVKSNSVWKEIPLSLLSILLLFFMVNDVMFDGASFDALTRIDGIALLSFFIIFMYYSFGMAKNKVDGEADKVNELSNAKSTGYILLGFTGLALGGKWIVDGAIYLASLFNMPESIVGLTVVAIGTSLPELATSVTAAMKKNADIAVGNTVGSNIFNVFWILGLSSVIAPLPFAGGTLNNDILMAVFASLLLFVFMFFGKRHILQKSQGAIFLLIYFGYMTYSVLNVV